MPISAITATASGRTSVACVPALKASKAPPPQARSIPSAIWDRALLCVQMNRTFSGFIGGTVDGQDQAHIKKSRPAAPANGPAIEPPIHVS